MFEDLCGDSHINVRGILATGRISKEPNHRFWINIFEDTLL